MEGLVHFMQTLSVGAHHGNLSTSIYALLQVSGFSTRTTWVRDPQRPVRVTPEQIQESVDRSLSRLGTDHLDLLQIHWPDRELCWILFISQILSLVARAVSLLFLVCVCACVCVCLLVPARVCAFHLIHIFLTKEFHQV